jgi:CubicO group peptidase (beta-lactamase class C family)
VDLRARCRLVTLERTFMTIRLRLLLGLLLATVFLPTARPSLRAVPRDASGFVTEMMTRLRVPGMQAAVAIDGRLVWSSGFGKADLEQDVAVTTATKFRIGSVSKTVTAAAIGRLVDAGVLELDAPVSRYVPSVRAEGLTVRHVAGHLSGIRNYRGAEFLNRTTYASVDDALAVFITDPLLSRPGEKFAYSSYNYTILSAVIEKVTRKPFLEAMDALVVAPLHLVSTLADVGAAIVPNRARWYELQDGRPTNAPFVDNSNKWAAGGYLSTSEDLVKLGSSMASPGFLKAGTLVQLLGRQRTTDGAPVQYGIGWRTDPQGGPQVWHGGEAMGARAFLFVDPPSRSVVAITCNLGGAAFAEKDARELLEIVRRTPFRGKE